VNLSQAKAMSHQVHTYTELLRQIHDDLRLQHPDWVQSNGESPICDFYEARLMELIDALTGTDVERVRESPMISWPHHLPSGDQSRLELGPKFDVTT
jgi:hypothetical protein